MPRPFWADRNIRDTFLMYYTAGGGECSLSLNAGGAAKPSRILRDAFFQRRKRRLIPGFSRFAHIGLRKILVAASESLRRGHPFYLGFQPQCLKQGMSQVEKTPRFARAAIINAGGRLQ